MQIHIQEKNQLSVIHKNQKKLIYLVQIILLILKYINSMAAKSSHFLVGISRFQSNFLRSKLVSKAVIVKDVFQELSKAIKRTYKAETDASSDKHLMEHNQKFQKILLDKKLIKQMDSFLDTFYRYQSIGPVNGIIAPKLDARTFLCAWMVIGFPEFIFGTTTDQLEKHKSSVQSYLYLNAMELIILLNALSLNLEKKSKGLVANEFIRKTFKQMNIYSNCFLQFKSMDIYNHINSIVNAWVKSSNTLDKVLGSPKYNDKKKKEIKEHMKEVMNEKVNMMRKMLASCHVKLLSKSEKEGLNRKQMIEAANEKVINMMQNMKKIINAIPEQAKRATIDKLKLSIEKKEYDEVMDVLKYLRKSLIDYHPKKGKERFLKELDDKFDLKFIETLIRKESFQCKDIMGLCSFMVNKLTYLQAPYRAEEIRNEWDELNKKYEEFINPESNKWEVVGANGLFFVSQLVEKLKEDLLRLEVMDKLFSE